LIADDVKQALVEAGMWEAFDSRRSPERRRLLQPIEDAARPATRERRIQALLSSLS